jgi:hypothetical protein
METETGPTSPDEHAVHAARLFAEVEEHIWAIGDPLKSLAAAAALREKVEHLIRNRVEYAHQDPWATWADIGDALGVSTQAAHKRYAH